ncbi:Putative amidase [Vanrija pseudolonga]|uniref:amidase n=1 Tax=Vanrija pseudolonga TaxID=143232 RepID=A0AAF1BRL2_9TREE|nr:Putative amidase [Vanrija pseudolonga]
MSPAKIPRPAAELAAEAIAVRDSTIPAAYRLPKNTKLAKNVTGVLSTSGILSAAELAIVELDATRLAEALAARKYTAVEVTTAYVKAAAIAQQVTNCLVELFAPEALERAAWLDAELERTGVPVGPFHGVPVSIKDHLDVKGHDSPSGFLDMIGNVATEDAYMVEILRNAGAVFYCKTTNPQSLMHLETECYLGVTASPWNTDLTAGGSSGGEGALIGMKGSPLGIGTDIGGSVRSPAAACGIYSFKPSVRRLPYGGANIPVGPAGWEGILGTHGPMGRSVDDLEKYMRLVASTEPWKRDPTLDVKPWREVQPKRLRVGVLYDDGVVRPVAPVRRALDTAVSKLRQSGAFDVVEYAPYRSADNWEIISALYWPDNGKAVYDHIAGSGERVLPLTEWIIGQAGDRERSREELWDLVARRDAFRAAFAAHWQATGMDILLTPVGPTPAPAHGTARYWNYTSFWNLVNYPAVVFPTGAHVDPAKDAEAAAYTPRNDAEADVYDSFDAAASVDAPLCLQTVGYIGYEEETLWATKQIVEVIQK